MGGCVHGRESPRVFRKNSDGARLFRKENITGEASRLAYGVWMRPICTTGKRAASGEVLMLFSRGLGRQGADQEFPVSPSPLPFFFWERVASPTMVAMTTRE